MAEGYSALENQRVDAANGISYAYRDTGTGGPGGVPLVLLQHFRATLTTDDHRAGRTGDVPVAE